MAVRHRAERNVDSAVDHALGELVRFTEVDDLGLGQPAKTCCGVSTLTSALLVLPRSGVSPHRIAESHATANAPIRITPSELRST